MDRFEEIRQAIIDRTGVSAWGTDARKACEPQSGEILKAADIKDTSACLIFEAKYGTKPGLRTVLLSAPDADSDLRVTMNMFASHDKTPVVTPTIERYRSADVSVAVELPRWYRLVDTDGRIIADDMSPYWAHQAASSMAHLGVRLVEMIGSSPARKDDDKEAVS